jgi:hypothetical protein
VKRLFVLTNQPFTHLSKPRIEHSAKRIGIINSNSYVDAKITFLDSYLF